MPLKIPNYGDWEGDKRGGHHPPACTCYDCNEERRRLEASKEEEHRAAEYDRRVARTRTQSHTQGPGQQRSGRAQPPRPSSGRSPRRPSQRPPQPPSRTGRGRRRGPSPRLWLGFLVVVAGLVAAVFFINNPDILAPLQDATVAVLTPTEEPRTNTPVLTLTPKPKPTTSSIPTLGPGADQAQPRSQPVPPQPAEAAEPVAVSPTPGPTSVPSPEGQSSEAPPDTALPSPTPSATVLPSPTPSATVLPSPTPSATVLIPPAPVAAPTMPPTTAPSRTPVPVPHLRHLAEKQYMLELINEERDRLALPLLELGINNAAQLHAESALEHCFSSHWGVDGLKPYMRYSLAGGYQSNGENGSGLDYCYKASDGYRAIQDIEHRIRQMMDGWMSSPGHRRNILDRWHKRVNIGFAWDRYNLMGFQHFEGDYVEYDQAPSLEGAAFTLSGNSKNGALVAQDSSVGIAIYYDPPPQPLTRGQLSRTYCYTMGLPVAFVLEPLPGDWYYPSDETTTSHQPCPDPYKMSPEAAPPSSPAEAHRHWQQAHDTIFLPLEVTVPLIVASDWTVVGQRFSVTADISVVLDSHGPGIYTMILWGKLGGTTQIISEYSIFHETE